MRIRRVLRNIKRELPKAGKRTGGLQSPNEGPRLPAKGTSYYDAPTQDYSRTFGWQHFDVQETAEFSEKQKTENSTQMMIDYIHKFIQEQRKLVYVKMQSKIPEVQADAISKWDRIEILLERIAEKSTDTQYIENLYNRVMDLNGDRERED